MPDDRRSDELTTDSHLDAAIRELDRLRRPETWVSASGDADAAYASMRPLKDETGAAHEGPDVDVDDELFAPEPTVAEEPEAARERRISEQDDEAAGPVAMSDYGAGVIMHPMPSPPENDDPVDDAAADTDEAVSTNERLGDFDVPEPSPSIPARFDSSNEVASDYDPNSALTDRLPTAASFPPVFGKAEEPSGSEQDVADLPRRMFGLKRALDAHRLGVSMDDLPKPEPVHEPEPDEHEHEPEPDLRQTSVSPLTSEVGEVTPAEPESEADEDRKGWLGSWRTTEPELDARPAEPITWQADVAQVAPAADPQPEPKVESMGWFETRGDPGLEVAATDPDAEAGASAGTSAAAAAAAAVPAARRKGWFGSRVTAPKPAGQAPTVVEPESEAPRKRWFRRRQPSEVKAEEAKPADMTAAAAAPSPASDAAKAGSDPFAAMAAAVAPKAKTGNGESKGWFGSKRAPAADVADPAASAHEMVDLDPVRAAMQAVAEKRPEISAADIATLAASVGVTGKAPVVPTVEAGRVGVLLINLGTPDAPKAKAVRRYLREFLSDKRVIEKDTFTWRLVLNGIILPFRPRRKARAYRAIWNKVTNESPLKTITRSQAEKLGVSLAVAGSDAVVDWAMRYGNPSIESRIKGLIAKGCDRMLLVPLYPQYSSATTATVCDEAFRVLRRIRNQPALRVAPPYYADSIYIEALANSIKAELAKLSFEPEVILASYHGMPLAYVQKGDPYYDQCVRTTQLLRARLGKTDASFIMTFQSRFGRAEWLQPYTDETLRKLAKDGIKNVAIITPGFAADCLETLEEIAIENAHIFKKKGGKNFAFIPCLNDSENGMEVIRELAARELGGWV